LPSSAVELCAVVFVYWLTPIQTRRSGSGAVRSTGMDSETADALEIGAEVELELMDACLTVFGKSLIRLFHVFMQETS
jgi:hypothetical protein